MDDSSVVVNSIVEDGIKIGINSVISHCHLKVNINIEYTSNLVIWPAAPTYTRLQYLNGREQRFARHFTDLSFDLYIPSDKRYILYNYREK